MNKDTISIKDYANKKGVSTQAVYKRLSTTLQPYVVEVDGHKRLKIEVLEFDLKTDDETTKDESLQPFATVDNLQKEVEKLAEKVESINADREKEVSRLEEEVAFLKEQLKIAQEEKQGIEEERKQLFAVNVKLNQRLLLIEEKKEEEIVETETKEEKKGFIKRLFNL